LKSEQPYLELKKETANRDRTRKKMKNKQGNQSATIIRWHIIEPLDRTVKYNEKYQEGVEISCDRNRT
jgi:hypothetical protein